MISKKFSESSFDSTTGARSEASRSNSEPAERPLGKFLPNPKAPLREQVREVMRFFHYSGRTEEAYWGWIVRYLRFHKRPASPHPSPGLRPPSPAPAGEGQWRHPREMGAEEVAAYLSHLATDGGVAASTQNQALHPVR